MKVNDEFGWGTKVYVQNQLGPSNCILQHSCLTGGSTVTSQDYNQSSVVYVSKLVRAIWRYLLSEFLCLALLFFISMNIFYLWFLKKMFLGWVSETSKCGSAVHLLFMFSNLIRVTKCILIFNSQIQSETAKIDKPNDVFFSGSNHQFVWELRIQAEKLLSAIVVYFFQ